jgi:hypothetical protein
MLREWAMMDTDTVNSVVASNLMRSFQSIKETDRVQQALPGGLKNVVGELASKLSMDRLLEE